MKVSKYDPNYTSFSDLDYGDVFFSSEESEVCMKVNDYNSAIILSNGYIIDVEDDTIVVPIPNARLVFD
jgi:hypothetical protein